MNQVQELEQAILARAERLAAEFRERAARGRDNILRESAERLHRREAREEGIARTLGDRTFRQRVQASELKMQVQLDRVRWNLVRDVEHALPARMRDWMEDQDTYAAWLDSLILGAAAAIQDASLVVAANSRDRRQLEARWPTLLAALPEGRTATLDEERLDTLGGVLVTSGDRRIRIDQTFEGRLARLRPRIQQVILERLLPNGFDTGNLFAG